jgi:hypothetical protein
MLCALAREPMPWSNVHLVQVDERVAPAGHTHRNLTHLHESLAPIAPQIHAMPVEEDLGGRRKLCSITPANYGIAANIGLGSSGTRAARPHCFARAGWSSP